MKPNFFSFVVLFTCGLLPLTFCQSASAQRFDVEKYLKRIDANGNGSLEASEMNGRTKDFIAKMGFNVEKSVSIKKVVSKVNKDRSRREAEERSKNAPKRNVPGFAPEESESSSTSVIGFSNDPKSAASSGRSSSKEKYSEKIMERVDDVLRRYDKDKNGILDSREIKDARWGSPPPLNNDKNRDGRLSKTELAQRYLDRERYSNRERNERGSSSRRDSSKKSSTRTQFKSTSRSFGSGSSGGSTKSDGSTSTASSSKADTQKFESYVDGLMDRYDKNKNGKFDKDEIEKMRRPPMSADVNKDGEITRKELLDMLTGKKPASSSSEKTTSKPTTDRRSRSKFGSSRGSSSRNGTFSSLDKNQDGRIQMYEYTDEWTDELAKEFASRDKNDDGILSEAEFRAK